jgi:hypothetical protein
MKTVNFKIGFMAIAISVAMASCGGGSGKKNAAGEIIDEAIKEAKITNSFSEAAAEASMKKLAGLGKKDVQPDFPYIIDENTKANYGDNSHAQFFFIKEDGEITKEEYMTWLKKVFDATAAVSDDGYNIQGYAFGKGEIEKTFEEATKGFMKVWSYKYKGKIMDVYPDDKTGTFSTKEKTYGSEGGGMIAVKIDIANGLQKSMKEYEKDIEKAFDEHGDEIKKALQGN